MTWEELLAEFRALGGTAENIRLAEGNLGRGVFVNDPDKPAILHASPNMIVPVDSLEIRDGQLCVKPGTVGTRESALFDNYQRYFGWGAGLYEEVWRSQEEWSTLPPATIEYITNMGGSQDPAVRFLPPSQDVCSFHYVHAREFKYHEKQHLVPLVDLVNHSSKESGYVSENGLGVSGTFQDEMLVRYNIFDTWAHVLTYGFSDTCYFAYSLGITIDLFGTHKVSIFRDADGVEVVDNIRYPKVTISGNVITLPFLILGNVAAVDTPRAIFRKLMHPTFTVQQADDTFDSMLQYNRSKFIGLLRIIRNHRGSVAGMLEEAAINQLDTLSACVGARPL